MGKRTEKVKDKATLDLFETPPPPAMPGCLAGLNTRIAHAMSAVIREGAMSRFEIVAKMSDLLGEEVSKAMLDSYTAESREDHNIPAYRLLAFILATDSFETLGALLKPLGCGLLIGKDAKLVALYHMQQKRKAIDQQIERMSREMGGER